MRAGLLAGASLSTHRRRERERRLSPAKPEPLQAWEGEGGALSVRTGSRVAQPVSPTTSVGGASSGGGGVPSTTRLENSESAPGGQVHR